MKKLLPVRLIAVLQLVLLLPAALFMAALVVRQMMPGSLVQIAERVVTWYAGRIWTLWVLLIALPMAALVSGGAALLANWLEPAKPRPAGGRLRLSTIFVVGETVTAGVILAIVAVHMLMN